LKHAAETAKLLLGTIVVVTDSTLINHALDKVSGKLRRASLTLPKLLLLLHLCLYVGHSGRGLTVYDEVRRGRGRLSYLVMADDLDSSSVDLVDLLIVL
jgi:hypothetical protein